MDDLTITVNINGISMNGVTYDTLSDAIKDAPIKELALPKTKFRISTSHVLK